MRGAHDLFRDCAGGDATAWDEFFTRYGRYLQLTVLRVVRQYRVHEEYEDVLQALSADLYARRRRIFGGFEERGADSDIRYLKVVVANWVRTHCKSAALRRRREVYQDPQFEPAVPPQDIPQISLDEALKILAADRSNQNIQRDQNIMRLYFGHGYTSAQIAGFKSLGLSESGVEGVILRSKRSIRQAIFSASGGREIAPELRSSKVEGP
jgi:DNA-directed RNA polymerase specialized sigma24 family protein